MNYYRQIIKWISRFHMLSAIYNYVRLVWHSILVCALVCHSIDNTFITKKRSLKKPSPYVHPTNNAFSSNLKFVEKQVKVQLRRPEVSQKRGALIQRDFYLYLVSINIKCNFLPRLSLLPLPNSRTDSCEPINGGIVTLCNMWLAMSSSAAA